MHQSEWQNAQRGTICYSLSSPHKSVYSSLFGDGDNDGGFDSYCLVGKCYKLGTVLCHLHAFFSFIFCSNVVNTAMEGTASDTLPLKQPC
jgi:hypothetical protein